MRNVRLIVRRDSEKKGDCYVTLRADIVGEGEGMKEIDFFFNRAAFEEFGSGRRFQVQDLWRFAFSYGGDEVVFSRQDALFDRGRTTRGVAMVPFVATIIPAFVRRCMLRMVQRVWDAPAYVKANDYDRPKVEIRIDEPRRERWLRLYGYGKGEVDIDDNQRTREALVGLADEPSFRRSFEQIEQIARNATRGFHQRARLVLHAEHWGGEFCRSFGWWAKDPRGRTIMSGGLIDHGPKAGPLANLSVQLVSNPEWSIHT